MPRKRLTERFRTEDFVWCAKPRIPPEGLYFKGIPEELPVREQKEKGASDSSFLFLFLPHRLPENRFKILFFFRFPAVMASGFLGNICPVILQLWNNDD